jgi:uncharacterized protein (UPF0332 family)
LTEYQQILLEKAQRNVGVASRLVDEGEWDVAVSRAYYAMFYAAQACLYGLGQEYSKHSAVIAAFGREFAKTGVLPRQLHVHLMQAEQARIQSDYEVAEPVPAEEARLHSARAVEFVAAIQQFLAS